MIVFSTFFLPVLDKPYMVVHCFTWGFHTLSMLIAATNIHIESVIVHCMGLTALLTKVDQKIDNPYFLTIVAVTGRKRTLFWKSIIERNALEVGYVFLRI